MLLRVTAAPHPEIIRRIEGRRAATVAKLVPWCSTAIFRYAVVILRADDDPAAALQGPYGTRRSNNSSRFRVATAQTLPGRCRCTAATARASRRCGCRCSGGLARPLTTTGDERDGTSCLESCCVAFDANHGYRVRSRSWRRFGRRSAVVTPDRGCGSRRSHEKCRCIDLHHGEAAGRGGNCDSPTIDSHIL